MSRPPVFRADATILIQAAAPGMGETRTAGEEEGRAAQDQGAAGAAGGCQVPGCVPDHRSRFGVGPAAAGRTQVTLSNPGRIAGILHPGGAQFLGESITFKTGDQNVGFFKPTLQAGSSVWPTEDVASGNQWLGGIRPCPLASTPPLLPPSPPAIWTVKTRGGGSVEEWSSGLECLQCRPL